MPYLRQKLAEQHPWVTQVYEQTSDFIHLSGRHFYNSIATTDEGSRTVRFVIGGKDPPRPDETYFEIADTFFEATKVVGLLLLGYFGARALQSGAPDLPEPDSPTRPRVSPGWIWKEMFWTAAC